MAHEFSFYFKIFNTVCLGHFQYGGIYHEEIHEKTQVVCTVSIKPAGLVSFGCDNPVVNLI